LIEKDVYMDDYFGSFQDHLEAKSTKAEVQRRFHMVGLGEAVRREVTRCEACRGEQPFKVQQPSAPYHVNRFHVGKVPF
jgi:hypothetical protein